MKRILLPLSLLLSVAACASVAANRSTAAPTADEAAVVAVANGLFDAMRTRDTAAIRAMFLPSAPIVSVGRRRGGETVVEERRVGDFLPDVATAPGELDERMWDPEVRVDGDLATLWAPYDFYRDDHFSHCGTDAFQFVRQDGAWKLLAITYTRRTTQCDASGTR